MWLKIPDLAQAVTGHFTDHHAAMAKATLRRLELVEEALRESDQLIAAACIPWQHQIDLPAPTFPAFRPPRTWRRGPVWRLRSTSSPALGECAARFGDSVNSGGADR